jgi:hypothetical protein
MTSKITGSGAVVYSAIPNSGTLSARIHIAPVPFPNDVASAYSTYTGGSTINSNTTVIVNPSSVLATNGTIERGPFGIGSVVLNGGTLEMGKETVETTLHNQIHVNAASSVRVGGTEQCTLAGTINLNGNRLTVHTLDFLRFADATFSSSDSETIAFGETVNGVNVDMSSGITRSFGGYVGEIDSGTVAGRLTKSGPGTFEAKHFRVGTIILSNGTLRVPNASGAGGDNTGASTSMVRAISATGGKLDLGRNELIVDYTGTTPIGVLTSATTGSGIARLIQSAYSAGTWGGVGITSSDTDGDDYGLGYAEASAISMTTFSGVAVDSTAVVIGFTYYGDATMDGNVNIGDFAIHANHYNQSGLWQDGDFNYDGTVNISDFSLLSRNYNQGGLLRGGLPPLAELYVAILDYPSIYWEARMWPELWTMFAPFEAMNLGPIPAVPSYLMARGVPEPVNVANAIFLTLLLRGRRYRAIGAYPPNAAPLVYSGSAGAPK